MYFQLQIFWPFVIAYLTDRLRHSLIVFSRYGNFSGINEKIQFKYLGKPRDRKDSEIRKSNYKKGEREAERRERRDTQTETRKESKENEAPEDNEHSLLLILKWGGELTMMGKDQALELGRAFRYSRLRPVPPFRWSPAREWKKISEKKLMLAPHSQGSARRANIVFFFHSRDVLRRKGGTVLVLNEINLLHYR